MKIKDIALSAAYVGQRVVKAIAVGVQEIWSAVEYIVFKDPVVAQICATNFGDGTGLTEEDASKVTDLGLVFKGNTEISSFDELEKFTSLKIIGRWGADGYRTFEKCTNLKSIRFPESVEDIGYYAFSGCTSLNIVLPTSIKRLERGAFNGVPLVGDIYLPNLKEIFGGTPINSDKITRITSLGSITTIPSGFMREKSGLTYCKIPDTVTRIDSAAFLLCTNLEDIGTDLSHVVEFSEQQNFYGTPKLKRHINLENLERMVNGHHFRGSGILSIRFGKLAVINGSVCCDCKNLEKVELSAQTTSIGDWSFSSCPALKEVIINASAPPTLGASAFSSTPSDMTIYVPDGSVQAYREASGWLSYADRIKPLSKYVEPTNE